MDDKARAEGQTRDRQVATLIGWFFLVLAVPVAAGTAFTELPIDRAINVAAAVVLALVGGGFLVVARRVHR